MTINYTTLLGLAEPVTGTQSGTWGDDVNKGITDYLDIAIAGTQTISGSQTSVTLSVTNGSSAASNIAQVGTGASGSAQYAIINCTGNPAGLLTITAPASSREYVVINATSTNQSVKVVGAGPTTGVTIIAGERALIAWNGSDYVKVATTAAAGGSNTQVQFNSSGVLAGSSNMTFNGTRLTVADLADSGLTSGRVTYASTGGALVDSANLTFDGTNLGVGTSSPGRRLDVAGNGRVTGGNGIFFEWNNGTDATYVSQEISGEFRINQSTPSSNSKITFQTQAALRATIDGSGNFGLGVTPNGWDGTVGGAFVFGSTGKGSLSYAGGATTLGDNFYRNSSGFRYTTTAAVSLYQATAGQHIWYNAPSGTAGNTISFTQAMTLDASGNLMVGTTTPTTNCKLTVSGAGIAITGGRGPTIALSYPDWSIYNTSSGNALAFDNGSERMRLDSSGNLGIGTSSPAYRLDVAASSGFIAAQFKSSFTATARIGTDNSQAWFGQGTNGINTSFIVNDSTGNAFIQTAGSVRATVDSSGNLGLGVTPSAWSGTNTRSFDISLWTSIANGNAFGSALTFNGFYNGSAWVYKQNNTAAKYEQDGAHRWYTAPSGTAGNAISFTQAMTLDASGNLAVGTTSALAKISIGGSGANRISMSGSTGTFFVGYDGANDQLQVASNTAVVFQAGSGYPERARIDSSGNFGLGINKVFGSGNGYAGNSSAASSATLELWDTNGNTKLYNAWGSGNLLFGTGNTERARITSGGDFAIGTTSAGGKLTVLQGTSQFDFGTNASRCYIEAIDRNNTSNSINFEYYARNGAHIWYNGGYTERARIDSSGNLLVGTTNSAINAGEGIKLLADTARRISSVSSVSTNGGGETFTMYSTGAAAYRFYVGWGGTVFATSTSISAISDRTLKENIRDLETGLPEVMALKPRRFDWKNGDAQNVAGFVAQEVEEVLPELVTDYKYSDTETKKSLKMGDILPTLVKAIQEQQAIITALTARVAALESNP